ncbi:hypothetical protein LT85_4073 [Collimonas arenae]|uniref:Uncharacterized protein n=1 Tax=Collimonas arenae TaxID=279058 RepID=A0A0A1FFG5_9BURK|nr:hypothetical protein LT85_4073 [Collimonas arenae]
MLQTMEYGIASGESRLSKNKKALTISGPALFYLDLSLLLY